MLQGDFPKENTIYQRNLKTTLDGERNFWRAMCDYPKAIRRYLAKDAVVVLPGGAILPAHDDEHEHALPPDADSGSDSGSLKDALAEIKPWTRFRIHDDPYFVEIDMMATSLIYRITLERLDASDGSVAEECEAVGSSVWRQDAAGEWWLCVHHVTVLPART